MTSERFISFLSYAIVAATLIFSTVVFVKELMKPSEMFEKIASDKCNNVVEIEEGIESEHKLEELASDCALIPEKLLNSTNFTKELRLFHNLSKFNYLFVGKKGILLQKKEFDYKQSASYIYKCLRDNECNPKDKTIVTLTYYVQNANGEIEISTTYNKLPVANTVKAFKKLYNELVSIKKLTQKELKLTLIFHESYTNIEDKRPEFINPLLKRKVDGLYLESRGAKIRLLPWEYSDNPFLVLDRKGRQYGLDKEEYKKEEASVYLYRTAQYIEKNGEAVKWQGEYSKNKGDYSDNLEILLISKHLKNIQLDDGSFLMEIDTNDGSGKEAKMNLNTQAEAAISLLKAAIFLESKELSAGAVKAIDFISQNSSASTVSSAYLLKALMLCDKNCVSEKQISKKEELLNFFKDLKNIEETIENNTVYLGVLLNAFFMTEPKSSGESRAHELLESSFKKYEKMGDSDKIRFISYLSHIDFAKKEELYKRVKTFFDSESNFMHSLSFKDRGFGDFKGSFVLSSQKVLPDTALSILAASGLSRVTLYGFINPAIADMTALCGNFLKYLTVTDDDFPNWGSPEAKKLVQGGIRAVPGAKTVKLANSARALEYFINREEKVKGK
ncbi:MAG: hypothetical protein ACOX2F_12020 [bacterium]